MASMCSDMLCMCVHDMMHYAQLLLWKHYLFSYKVRTWLNMINSGMSNIQLIKMYETESAW